MNRRRLFGFTLIELMIAVAIVGLLAAIAYPSYLNQVRKARRSEARSALLQAANREERYYSSQYTYTATLGDGGLGMKALTQNKYYKLSLSNADKASFTISAVAQGDQTNDDCTTLKIDETGARTANSATSAGANISQQCWP